MSLSEPNDMLIEATALLEDLSIILRAETSLLALTMADVVEEAAKALSDAAENEEWKAAIEAERAEELRLHNEKVEGIIGTGRNPCDTCTVGWCDECPGCDVEPDRPETDEEHAF